ncbi:hypothetical protein D3C81_1809740 [compost metagenome]
MHFVLATVEQFHRHAGFLRQIRDFEQPVLSLPRAETAAGDQFMNGHVGLVDAAHGLRRFQCRGRHLHTAPVSDRFVLDVCGDADRFQRVLHLVGHGVIGFDQLRRA